jgi:hypothetical protein
MVNLLPFGGQQVPVPGFGAMGLSSAMGSDLSLEQAEPVLLKAIELGCTFWDTAVTGSWSKLKMLFLMASGSRLPIRMAQTSSYLGILLRSITSMISFLVSLMALSFIRCVMTHSRCYAVASKCGFDVFGPQRRLTNSATHIKEYIEGTINRLGSTPGLYYLHRIDPSAPRSPT